MTSGERQKTLFPMESWFLISVWSSIGDGFHQSKSYTREEEHSVKSFLMLETTSAWVCLLHPGHPGNGAVWVIKMPLVKRINRLAPG
jgi:hypothetical protein